MIWSASFYVRVCFDRTILLLPALSTQRAALRKARRLSRPFLKAMAVPLAMLLVARLALGNLLAKTVDPTLELLFSDDVLDLCVHFVAEFFRLLLRSCAVVFWPPAAANVGASVLSPDDGENQ